MHYRLISKNTMGAITDSTDAGDDLTTALSQAVRLRHELNAPHQIDLLSVPHDGIEHKLVQFGGFE